MPPITTELLVTVLAVTIAALAFLHLIAGARASVVLAHQIEYERRNKPPASDPEGTHPNGETHAHDAHPSTDTPPPTDRRPAHPAPVEVG